MYARALWGLTRNLRKPRNTAKCLPTPSLHFCYPGATRLRPGPGGHSAVKPSSSVGICASKAALCATGHARQSMSGVEDGNRELHISTVSIEPEGVCVAVRDTGHGLRPESLPRLFEPFSSRSAARLSKPMVGGCGRPGASRGVLSFSLRSPLTEPPSVKADIARSIRFLLIVPAGNPC
jgi:hypothetical protein